LCLPAYLGQGKLNILLKGLISIKLKTFNPARGTDEELVRYMTAMMTSGDCRSEANPLIIAVDPKLVIAETLTKDPADVGAVQFVPGKQVALELLAGMHRVVAARRASQHLRELCQKLLKQLGRGGQEGQEGVGDKPNGEGEVDELEEETQTSQERQHQERVAALERQVEKLKEMIEAVETWPVKFYDIGALYSSHHRGRVRGKC